MIDPNAAIMSWEQADQIIQDQRAEIARLKEAISRLADQDATLSVCNGNVLVTMDTALTNEELRALMHGAISLRMHAGELSNTEAVENIMNLAKTLDSLREKHERHAT